MKEMLRNEMIARRKTLCKREAEGMSQRISSSVLHWILSDYHSKKENYVVSASKKGFFKRVLILGYMAVNYEVDVFSLMKELSVLGAAIALPRVKNEKEMEFFEVDFGRIKTFEDSDFFERSNYKILEPLKTNPKVDMQSYKKIYLILPCVGLNGKGQRLGYGAGYYDRFFHSDFMRKLHQSQTTLIKIAPVYSFQKNLEFIGEEHDIRADIIVTEQESTE